ncbi:MAG: MoaD/ThiS family protein [Gemmatimonadota bacterium]|jgi:molybdopterin converting factor small subunit|nr:MoaD/ThiS family protein [Gemmatimonadota bacterium]MDQ8146882.1 MoaD/ThiS family protein [Gemmatimonadota bacterium]MDQ8149468.1 MoaD/ThiS family protein [Gemmatimonadota bacterium]MDQ8157567.1 MoaD/ThiS family protein [Gemmatimonadota bacterium]MDQ8177128.1 MoaD/ThiS family protein [Gemmatimonadota bacterium]
MVLSVLCFASWGDALGPVVSVELPDGATVAQLLEALGGRVASSALPVPMIAVNRRYAAPSTILRAGDEVAVIPPVAGG